MEKSSKRGKIPQSDWPLIMARYEAGETLASIARTYDCSPPAISYVVSRSRARQPGPEIAAKLPGGLEPQLIKAPPPDAAARPAMLAIPARAAAAGPAGGPPPAAPPAAANGHGQPAGAPPDHRPDTYPPREWNGFAGNGAGERGAGPTVGAPRTSIAPPIATPANGEQRRTL